MRAGACAEARVGVWVFSGGWGMLLAHTQNIEDAFSKLLSFLTSVRV
jgi:hypothetical protein